MKKTFLAGAGVLALSVIFAKVLGAAYRIPLANIVGAEGMGLYQFVYPVFALLLTLSSGAVPTAISITVSKYLARGEEAEAKKFFSVALKVCFLVGLSGTLVLTAAAYPLSLLQSKEALVGYLTIAPAVLIVTLISVFRGWFMGHKDMVPGSISQITEGIVKLGVGITLAKLLLPYGISYAVAGALAGVVASELVTLIILLFTFIKKDKEGFVKVSLKENGKSVRELAHLAAPLIVCGMILPLSQFIDSIILVNLLKLGGQDLESATASYGVFSGAVSPLINLPVMVCISLGIAITPQMVEGREKRDVDFIMDKCATATKLTFVLGVPFVFLFVFMAEGIVGLFFPSLGAEKLALAGKLLQITALSVLGLSLFQIYSAMLQGLGKTVIPVKIMSFCMIVKTVLSVIMVPLTGIIGAAISASVGYLAAGVTIMAYFFRYVRKTPLLAKNSSLITLCGVIMGMIIFMSDKLQSTTAGVIAVGAASMAVYVIGLFVLKVFTPSELESMPLGKYLVKIDEKINGNGAE